MSRVRNQGTENGVSNVRLWRAVLGVESAVIERVEFDEDEQVLVVRVRPGRRARGRCG